jgi:hypothetical protein
VRAEPSGHRQTMTDLTAGIRYHNTSILTTPGFIIIARVAMCRLKVGSVTARKIQTRGQLPNLPMRSLSRGSYHRQPNRASPSLYVESGKCVPLMPDRSSIDAYNNTVKNQASHCAISRTTWVRERTDGVSSPRLADPPNTLACGSSW